VKKRWIFAFAVVLLCVSVFYAMRPKPEATRHSALLDSIAGKKPAEKVEIPTKYGGGSREAYIFEGDYQDVVAAAKIDLANLNALSPPPGEGNATLFFGKGVEIHIYEGKAVLVSENIATAKKNPRTASTAESAVLYESVNVAPQKGLISVVILEREPNAVKTLISNLSRAAEGGSRSSIGE
jgi:hypothetical protein